MVASYWSKIFSECIGRRRALMLGGSAVGAAILTACGGGGGSKGPGRSGASSGLLTEPVESTARAKRGGILKDQTTGDPNTLDIAGAINPLNPPARLAYSTLVRFAPGVLKPSDNSLMPDLAESWEWSPDGLQVTLKLRQGVKWHNKPPVNGRALDVDDVLFAWDRFTRTSTNRVGIANVVNPQAPVLSLTATDAKTVVVKLKEPLVYGLELFASAPGSYSGAVIMIPKETDTTFDIRNDMIGTGAFVMAKHEPSVGFTMTRNPDYFDKDWALVDEIDLPIISEYAASLAQLKAGNIYYYAVRPEDLLSIKGEEPRLLIYRTDLAASTNVMTFGQLPEGKSPFLDERVRQAVSMSWDRDLWLDTFYNVAKFGAEGLPVQTRHSTALAASWDGWWLDPKSKDFGPNAKYYRHDVAEAKKLMAAAGYPNGLQDVASNHIITNELGNLPRFADALDGMVSDIGITTKVHPVDYAKDYIPNYRDGHGQYQGWAFHTSAGGTGVGPVGLLANEYWSKGGSAFHGFSTSGRNDQSGDPQVDALIEKARVEQDVERRRALVSDIQRYLAKSLYALLVPGGATGFTMAWPALGNFRVYSGPQVWGQYRLWIDDTKPPFKNA